MATIGYRSREAWLVTDELDGSLTLVATNTDQHDTAFPNITITTTKPNSSAPRDLTAWESSQRQLLESKGLKDIEKRTIHFEGETVVCLGGQRSKGHLAIPELHTGDLWMHVHGSAEFHVRGPKVQAGGLWQNRVRRVHKVKNVVGRTRT